MSYREAQALFAGAEAAKNASWSVCATGHVSGAFRAWLQPRWRYQLQIEVVAPTFEEAVVKIAEELVRKCFN